MPELEGSETPEYLGRAVAALAADGDVLRYSGQVLPCVPPRRDTQPRMQQVLSTALPWWSRAGPPGCRAGQALRLHRRGREPAAAVQDVKSPLTAQPAPVLPGAPNRLYIGAALFVDGTDAGKESRSRHARHVEVGEGAGPTPLLPFELITA